MIEVDLRKHHEMFRRAWLGVVGEQKGLPLEESKRRWEQEFGCKMITGKGNLFVTAVFENNKDYSAFLLRWG
jgi:hypothetical protein